jgi:hypothetical protein
MDVRGKPTASPQQRATTLVTTVTVNAPGRLAQEGEARVLGAVGDQLLACASWRSIFKIKLLSKDAGFTKGDVGCKVKGVDWHKFLLNRR